MDWESWKQEYGGFSAAEDAEKKRVWEATLAEVTAHNLKHDQGLVSYRLGMNKFAVLGPPLMDSPGEIMTDSTAPPMEEATDTTSKPSVNYKDDGYVTTTSVNYKDDGYVTSVKDQGQCGSCYAFAAVGVLEGQNIRRNKRFMSLSAQQLVDCSDNGGCKGGSVYKCFEYAKNGLATNENYPYKGKKGPCQKKAAEVKVVQTMTVHTEPELISVVLLSGPTAVAIHIPRTFFFITNDIDVYDSTEPGIGWHAVLVVGYGTNDQNVDYWIIKNSWGTGWGGDGYALIKQGVNLMQIGDHGCIAFIAHNEQISQTGDNEAEKSEEN